MQGVVRGDDGVVISQAVIRLRAKEPTQLVVARDICTTDSQGRYFIVGWSTKPIRWRLSVEAKEYRPYDSPDVDLTSGDARTIDIRLEHR